MSRQDHEDRVEITKGDLKLLFSCATSYGHQLPYGLVPEHLWALLDDEDRADLRRTWEESDWCLIDPRAARACELGTHSCIVRHLHTTVARHIERQP